MKKMTEKDVLEIISNDERNFFESKWKGIKPENLLEIVKSFFDVIPPAELDLAYRLANNILLKNEDDLTTDDVRLLLNWSSKINYKQVMDFSPFLHKIDFYREFQSQVGDAVLEYTLVHSKFMQSLERKKYTLLNSIKNL